MVGYEICTCPFVVPFGRLSPRSITDHRRARREFCANDVGASYQVGRCHLLWRNRLPQGRPAQRACLRVRRHHLQQQRVCHPFACRYRARCCGAQGSERLDLSRSSNEHKSYDRGAKQSGVGHTVGSCLSRLSAQIRWHAGILSRLPPSTKPHILCRRYTACGPGTHLGPPLLLML